MCVLADLVRSLSLSRQVVYTVVTWATNLSPPTLAFTFGLHNLDLGRMNLRALIYSAAIRLEAGTRSLSDLFTTTRSATSTMPFLIPKSETGKCDQWHRDNCVYIYVTYFRCIIERFYRQTTCQMVQADDRCCTSLLHVLMALRFTFLTKQMADNYSDMELAIFLFHKRFQ